MRRYCFTMYTCHIIKWSRCNECNYKFVHLIKHQSVHCQWDEWKVGECSKTCGGGLKTNTRQPSVTANHGGQECSGSSKVTESCNIQECPGTKCILNIVYT
jgi:hypothetical protein